MTAFGKHQPSAICEDVIDSLKEAFSDQRVKCFGTSVFVEGPEATRLWQSQRDSGVLLELATDLGE